MDYPFNNKVSCRHFQRAIAEQRTHGLEGGIIEQQGKTETATVSEIERASSNSQAMGLGDGPNQSNDCWEAHQEIGDTGGIVDVYCNYPKSWLMLLSQ